MHSVPSLLAFIEASLSLAMSSLKGHLWVSAGLPPVVANVSRLHGLILNACTSSCSVDLCLFTDLLAHFLTGLCNRCCSASIAMRTADLYKCFSISK
jgi:hypothetical protein